MDVWYTRNISFGLDCKIVVDTVKAVMKKEGISSESSASMEEFMGTPDGVESQWKAPRHSIKLIWIEKS